LTVFIFLLTLRQLLGRKSTLLLLLLALLAVFLAIVFRLSDPDIEAQRWTARVLYRGLVVTAVLPLTALLLGTSVIGDELEDGTAVYLLTKPLARWQILLPKLAAAWLVTSALVVPAIVVSGLIALEGGGGASIVTGFAIATLVGALAYVTVFVLFSLVTTRALIAGLVYVFIWEGAVTALFTGTRYLSIRHYTLGLARWIADTDSYTFDATVSGTTALVMFAIVTAAAGFYANRCLQRIEVREPS
jgi:ABC-2 type transport system permease protein